MESMARNKHSCDSAEGWHSNGITEAGNEGQAEIGLMGPWETSCLTKEVPDDWRLANVMVIHKKVWKEDPGNCRLVSLTSVPDKLMEQIILSAITRHLQDIQRIRHSQHGFRKGKSCLTNLVNFYDQVTCLVDEGKAVDVAYLDFSKAFDTVSPGILLENLSAHGLDSVLFAGLGTVWMAGPRAWW
ncbi:RNA-directed DNA polymerase from mobile element jockey-like protein [Willisornis vidua]|uniref:RNA-directed DNA polymerase from mobile element jockey-like protein n=1 Tax=Willisornis vidua TaxID=1566151 RepID=A0ABQ9D9U6_9PASS|nr:RNA-directed DNA polymerase from mobile element jockey-like protein [Willisornis vidua]